MDTNKNFLKVDELLDLAIEFEQESADYYQKLQNNIENQRVLDMLKELENQEIEHRDILKNFELEDKPYPMLQFGPSFSITLPEVQSDSPTLRELLDVAIDREIVSRQIYNTTAGQVFGNLAQVLQDLAAFEGEHETKLKDLRSYLLGEDKT